MQLVSVGRENIPFLVDIVMIVAAFGFSELRKWVVRTFCTLCLQSTAWGKGET